jgi:AcrR family transcriptional regulator
MLTPRRNDSRRTRAKILQVADGAFAGRPDVVALDEIARRAGLGRATVYRHFSDRRTLAIAVAGEYYESLRQVVGAMGEERMSFRDVLHWVLSTQISMRPLVRNFRELPAREQRQYADLLIDILTPPFLRAQAEGELRQHVRPADFRLVLAMIVAAADEASDEPDDAALHRLITVVLDGLFVEPAESDRPTGWTPPRPFGEDPS